MKYFKNVTGFSDLKQQYRTLLKANHPDNGGDEEVMKAINMEYDVLFPVWKSREESETETVINETSSSTRRRFYTEFGWEGSRYNSELSLKEIAQIVRAYVKEKYPTYKFSVRTSYASMCQELHVDLKESPIPVYKQFDELTLDDFDNLAKALFRYDSDKQLEFLNAPREEQKKIIESSESYDAKILNEITCAVVEDVDAFVKSYNYNDSDGMIDYFDVNFYYFGCCRNNGANISIVPKTARFSENKNNLKRKNASHENADKSINAEIEEHKKHVREEIKQEATAAEMSVEEYTANEYESYAAELPDSSVSIDDMKKYGYTWDGMLPLKEASALQLYKKEIFQIFLLYEDGSESIAESAEDIKKHADRGGILGIHKEDWNKFIEPEPIYYVQKEDIGNNESNVHELRVVYSRMSEEPDFDEITDPMVHMGYTLYRGSFDQCMDYMDKLNKKEITEEQIKTDNQDNFPKKIFYYAIDESAARRAKEANSFSDYKPGSATEEYRQMVDKAVEIAEQ